MFNKSVRGQVTDPHGKTIQPLRYRQPRRLHNAHRLRHPVALIVLVAIIGLFVFIPPIRPAPYIIQSLTGQATVFPFPPTFTMPPAPTNVHGGVIIFTCTRGEINQLCIVNADGSGLKQLTRHNAHDYYPSFLPQGGTILFASNRNGSFDIYMMMLSNSKLYQLTQNIGNAFAPVNSPDGKMILFINRPSEGPASLWIMESTGKNPHILYSGNGAIVGADWSPDGNTIAFAMAVEQPAVYEIFLLDLTDLQKAPYRLSRNLAGITGSLDWSPDGKYLLLCAGPGGDKDIFQIEVASNAIIQLTDGGNNAAASYSPDGQWIAFNSLRNNNQTDLFIMKANGTYQRQLTDDPEPDWQPQWEP
jgi:TolB protein